MKKTLVSVFAFAALSLAAGIASAQTASNNTPDFLKGVGVNLKGGTAGFGLDVTKAINENFKVRAGYSNFKYSKDRTEDDITYDANLRLGGFSLLGDYHPWASGFRVTAGVYRPNYDIGGKARYNGSGTIDINGTTYSSSDLSDVTLDAKWGGIRPYLGLGYDGFQKATKGGLFFTADAGVVFAGSPSVSLRANCTNPSLCAQAASDIASEEARLRNDIGGAKYLPVIQVGVGYRF